MSCFAYHPPCLKELRYIRVSVVLRVCSYDLWSRVCSDTCVLCLSAGGAKCQQVGTKDMTYSKQLKAYEDAVIAKRFEELQEDEVPHSHSPAPTPTNCARVCIPTRIFVWCCVLAFPHAPGLCPCPGLLLSCARSLSLGSKSRAPQGSAPGVLCLCTWHPCICPQPYAHL